MFYYLNTSTPPPNLIYSVSMSTTSVPSTSTRSTRVKRKFNSEETQAQRKRRRIDADSHPIVSSNQIAVRIEELQKRAEALKQDVVSTLRVTLKEELPSAFQAVAKASAEKALSSQPTYTLISYAMYSSQRRNLYLIPNGDIDDRTREALEFSGTLDGNLDADKLLDEEENEDKHVRAVGVIENFPRKKLECGKIPNIGIVTHYYSFRRDYD